MRPFRFGAMPYWANIQPNDWVKTVQHVEKLGYSTMFEVDHFDMQAKDPMVVLAYAAAVTKKLNVGTLVFDVDFQEDDLSLELELDGMLMTITCQASLSTNQ